MCLLSLGPQHFHRQPCLLILLFEQFTVARLRPVPGAGPVSPATAGVRDVPPSSVSDRIHSAKDPTTKILATLRFPKNVDGICTPPQRTELLASRRMRPTKVPANNVKALKGLGFSCFSRLPAF